MSEEKKSDLDKVTFTSDTLRKYFPKSYTPQRMQETIIKLALLGMAVLITYSLQNGIILLVMAFLVSPYGLPLAAIWLLGKVQDLRFAIQDAVYG